jgi:hypothetical protein
MYFLSSVIGIFATRKIGRKTLLYPGHIAMGICHTMVGIFSVLEISTGAFIFIMLFLFFYNATNGVVVWLYCSEVAVDSALGICMLVLWCTILLITLTSKFLMHSAL